MKFKLVEDLVESKLKFNSDEEVLEYIYSLDKIQFYEKKNGEVPVEDFLLDIQNSSQLSNILYDMSQLNNLGRFARKPLSSYVEDGILELRTKYKDGITRIFYFFIDGNIMIMTNAYTKKQQKLDENELEKAKKYRDDYYMQEGR